MPDASILITAKDNYSSAVSKMSQITRSFSKDAEEMERKLYNLNTQKTSLKLDADQALSELKELKKQFAETGDEADGLKVQLAQANYDNITRNLSLVTRGAKAAQTQMEKTNDAFRKAGNQPGSTVNTLLAGIASSGIAQMVQTSVSGLANSYVASAFGSETSTLFSNALSSGLSGASTGFMVGTSLGSALGPMGAAVGAAAGTAMGLFNGVVANAQKEDDAFKSYVQDTYDTVKEEQSSSLSSGSATAAGRETTLMSFTTLFGGEDKAGQYLSSLRDFAAKTPFEYDDLTALSKTLKTFGYAAEDMIPALTKVGDAGAALGLGTSDVSAAATYIGRMNSSDKATLEYLNPLNERGFSVFQWIADDLDTTIADVYDRISKSELSGSYVSDLILKQFETLYGGMMDIQSRTFTGLSSTLADAQTELDNAMGKGYNEERKKGIQSEIDFLSGESGTAMEEAYGAIGAWQADLENQKEKYIRDALEAAMASDEYIAAKQEGNAAEMGRIIMAAKVRGQNEYNASEGAQLALQADLELAKSIQEDTASDAAYWDAGYQKGQQFSEGIMAGILGFNRGNVTVGLNGFDDGGNYLGTDAGGTSSGYLDDGGNFHPYAFGLERVPYDNFPALLHEGERVLTASEARSYPGAGGIQVTVTGNNIAVRDEDDIDKIAETLVRKISRAAMLAVPSE